VAVRPRFDPAKQHVVARSFTYLGVDYKAGDPFNQEGIAPFHLNTLYGSRAINQTADDPAAVETGVRLTQVRPGYFEIAAPWFDEPEKVRGKAKADERLAELREQGEPLDHHGVAIEETGGGWYDVKAEWEDEPRKVQGFDAAREEASLLRDAGPPPEHYAMVVVRPVEDGDGYVVAAPWQEVETYPSQDEAKARAQAVREAGPPEDFDPEVAAREAEERAEAARVAAEEGAAAEAEQKRRAAYSEAVSFAEITEGDATSYRIKAPGLKKPEDFDDEAEARARYEELRNGEPPKGFQPDSE
jgi:hypothetical protein